MMIHMAIRYAVGLNAGGSWSGKDQQHSKIMDY